MNKWWLAVLLMACACQSRDHARDAAGDSGERLTPPVSAATGAHDAGVLGYIADASTTLADAGQARGDAATTDAAVVAAPSGSLGPWLPTPDYPLAANNCAGTAPDLFCAQQTCVANADYVYCIGGAGTATYYSQLSADGMGPWKRGSDYPVPIQSASCVISADDSIYCVGGRAGATPAAATDTAAVYYAPLSASGIGAWTLTTPYPNANGAVCSVDSTFIYCLTGAVDPQQGEAYYAPIDAHGVGTWKPTTPVPGNTLGCAANGGYLYCYGAGGCFPGGPMHDCYTRSYYAPLTAQGIGTWKTTSDLPTAVSATSAIAGSYIYYLSTPVFFAQLSADGISPWQMTTNAPSASLPTTSFSNGKNLYFASPASSSSYYATIGAPNPNALALQNPPPFPRAQYLGQAKNARGSVSVSGPDFFSGAPLFYLSIDDAFVFDCASDAATAAGCKTTVVSPTDPTYNYDLTVWYPCNSSTQADQNCCFLPAHGYPDPFDDWCISVGSNAFIIAAPMTLSPSQ